MIAQKQWLFCSGYYTPLLTSHVWQGDYAEPYEGANAAPFGNF